MPGREDSKPRSTIVCIQSDPQTACLLLQAQEEQQLMEQIEQELLKARQQVELQRKQRSTSGAAAQQGVPAAKCCIALQERLSHKKQQLDEAVSR